MHFLGREAEEKLERGGEGGGGRGGGGGEGGGGGGEVQRYPVREEYSQRKVYAGVAVFCLPDSLEGGRDNVDIGSAFQVRVCVCMCV